MQILCCCKPKAIKLLTHIASVVATDISKWMLHVWAILLLQAGSHLDLWAKKYQAVADP